MLQRARDARLDQDFYECHIHRDESFPKSKERITFFGGATTRFEFSASQTAITNATLSHRFLKFRIVSRSTVTSLSESHLNVCCE